MLHRIEDLRHAKRFEDEIGSAGAQRLDGGVQVGEGGDQDHLAGEAVFAQLLEPDHAAFAGQRDVQNDQVDMVAAQPLRAVFGTARAHHEMAARCQRLDEEVEHALLVVDDQDRPVGPALQGFVGPGGRK
ncbi:hypothetical protein D9M69_584940 [compost metagenome]